MPDRRHATTARRAMVWVAILLVGALGFGVGRLWPTVARPPLVIGQDAVSDAASRQARSTLADGNGQAIVIRPPNDDGRLLFILYPGGQVRPQAYEWLGRALAASGVMTIIPAFTADLAVTDVDRADVLIERYAGGRPVVIGGHSLGGAMAAEYASRRQDALRGLVLLAAYPPDNVRVAASYPALSLWAENDAVADRDEVAGGMQRLPEGSQLIRIDGAVHSFFGRYGPQAGDGTPTISRADAEARIVAAIAEYAAGIT